MELVTVVTTVSVVGGGSGSSGGVGVTAAASEDARSHSLRDLPCHTICHNSKHPAVS
jgi:hypothetical protein